ncbi:uncharacterized protein LOC131434037 [Malaya genurostris]|uniref:uncharacterized protein LOC131434037 n=1 Tax=Malaya genurostris TaxID=325434 RepID=UPI0026F3A000|nr:uncharacterized protein LOC131434037 [Malaya genurostris]
MSATERPSTADLKIMALRQQHQIDTQQQLLATKEQRLRFLKAQEACESIAIAEGERLRRLRERVEAQESKLRRLRVLRGQVDLQKTYNIHLGNDLDTIRALFSEKEKELTLAVAKVEALTRQLEELRRDRKGSLNLLSGLSSTSAAAVELEKMRNELMYRNQLSLQQDVHLNLQREALQTRKAELISVDHRILELQGRLHKKKILNVMKQNNSSYVTNAKSIYSNHFRPTTFHAQHRTVPRNNIVAVEPFNHLPQTNATLSRNENKINISNNKNDNISPTQTIQELSNIKIKLTCQLPSVILHNTAVLNSNLVAESDENKLAAKQKRHENMFMNKVDYDGYSPCKTKNTQESCKMLDKSDDSYKDEKRLDSKDNYDRNQHVVNINVSNSNMLDENINVCDSDKVTDFNEISTRTQLAVTVHSTPMIFSNKSVAIPVSLSKAIDSVDVMSKAIHNNAIGIGYTTLHTIPSGNLVVPPRKPNKNLCLIDNSSCILPDSKEINNAMHQLSELTTHTKTITDSIKKIKPALPPKPSKCIIHHTGIESINFLEGNSKIDKCLDILNSSPTSENENFADNLPIKAKPLTIKKSPYCEQPKLRQTICNVGSYKVQFQGTTRVPDMHKTEKTNALNTAQEEHTICGVNENMFLEKEHIFNETNDSINCDNHSDQLHDERSFEIPRRKRSFVSTVITDGKRKLARRVSFDPLALLLDASLEGELELVQKSALQVPNPSAANDEGITALHNAICAGHVEIVRFLVGFGCDINAQDSDGWTPLHCAASCNNLAMVKYLIEAGACLFAATLSDHETPAEKCEEDEEGFDGCSEYIYNIQEKLGILNNGEVYAVFSYDAQQTDELSFSLNDKLIIIRKGDDSEREWWWARDKNDNEGYVPRNLLGLCPRVTPSPIARVVS